MNSQELSADSILKKSQKQRVEIIENLRSRKIKKWEDLEIVTDRECQVNLGLYIQNMSQKSNNICQSCEEISLLTDTLDESIINIPFDIKYGERIGDLLIVETEKDVITKLQYQKNIDSNLEYLFKYFTEFQACDSALSLETEFLAVDKFTNKLLINYILQDIIPENLVKIKKGYICGKDGFILSEEPIIGDISGIFEYSEYFTQKYLKSEIVRSIIIQLCQILEKLKPYNFCHNNGVIDSLYFDESDNGDISLKLRGLDYSSVNLENLRIYNKNTFSLLYIKNEPYLPDIKINQSVYQCDNNVNTYKFQTQSAKQILQLRRLGIPIFNTSFDLYCFIISLCLQPEFYQGIMNDSDLGKLFESIWTVKDYVIVTERLKEKHLIGEYNLDIIGVIEILSGLTLRCGFLEYLSQRL